MRSLKRIKLNNRYDFTFLLKPLMLLSVVSAVTYGLKLLGVAASDKIFFTVMIIVLITITLNHINNIYKKISFVLILFIFIILYLNIYEDLIVYLANKCEKNGVTFGVLNSVFNTFGLTDFENLIYHTSYGGAKFIDGKIATGAVDIFQLKQNCREAQMYLCGRYLTLFSAVGIALAINKHRKEVLFITIFAFLTGNLTVYLLMLLFVFMPYYFIFLLFSFICYFIANVAEVNAGFGINGSILELIVYRDNIIYILALGMFLCAVAYYLSRLAKEKRKW